MTKPHIYFHKGFWRVNCMPHGGWRTISTNTLWRTAHEFVNRLNWSKK